MTRTIRAGGLVVKDPNSEELFAIDWDLEHLRAGVQINSQTFYIAGADAILTKDSESLLTAAQATTQFERTVTLDNRGTQLRLKAGTLGTRYTVTNRIVTNETPAQTKDASFIVLIQNR